MQPSTDSLSEVIRALTDDRLKIADLYTRKVAACATGVIMSGSTAYGPYASVKPTSDVDLLVIVPNVEQRFPDILDRTPHDISHFKETGVVGYSPRKIQTAAGIKTSIRVITESAFKDVCSAEPVEFNIYKPRVKDTVIISKGFDGSSIENMREKLIPAGFKGFITPSPNAFIIDGKYYLGSYIDRILSCGKVLHDKDGWTANQMQECWKNVSKRLLNESMERIGRVDLSQLSIAKALCRFDRMPASSQEFINSQTRKWVEVAQGTPDIAH